MTVPPERQAQNDQTMKSNTYGRAQVCVYLLFAVFCVFRAEAQTSVAVNTDARREGLASKDNTVTTEENFRLVTSVLPGYYSQTEGMSLEEIIRQAFQNNGDIKIARLEVEKARARLDQTKRFPNPVLELEQSSGRLFGSGGEGSFSAGVGMPIDIYGQRRRRIDLAQAEVTLREAEVASLEREISAQIFVSYSEALSALRELKVLEDLLELDTETTRFVQIRVNEGEVAPLELSLLQTEVERLRARRSLIEGKLQAAYSRLRFFAGVDPHASFRLREDISTAQFPQLPPSIEVGLSTALRNRPELRVAALEEDLANAGLRLARAQGKADLTGYTRYTQGRSTFDDPRGAFAQRDRSLTFGLTISLPVFDRNQGAKAEAEISIRQARERRVFYEQIVKSEVAAAFQRLEASRRALSTLEVSVIPRSLQNVATVRQVYELGQLQITDLIAEQRRLLDAHRDLTETLTERYRAQADLFIATGLKF